MLHLRKTKDGKNFYATLIVGRHIVWETSKTQYSEAEGALDAMFSGWDGFNAAGSERTRAKAMEIWYKDHTGGKPERKLHQRRVR